MRDAPLVVGWLWAAFVVYWLVLGQFNKKASRSAPWWSGWRLGLGVILGVIIFTGLRRPAVAGFVASIGHSMPLDPGVPGQWLGVALCVAGFGFAMWARGHLGRNWGMPMSLRQGHELVTTGPYSLVRHPIYTGVMLAMIGSVLALGAAWLVIFAIYLAYFLLSARTEEKMMLAQFPDSYPAYRRRTKMLIPFVF